MTRDAIAAEALTWEGTPYHERACVKGIGVDCAMLPFAVYQKVGLLPADAQPPVYTSSWMMHRDEEWFLTYVKRYGREIGRDQVGVGDFAIWKYGRVFSHGAIVLRPPVILHAVIVGHGVIRADMDRDIDLADRPARFFTLL